MPRMCINHTKKKLFQMETVLCDDRVLMMKAAGCIARLNLELIVSVFVQYKKEKQSEVC